MTKTKTAPRWAPSTYLNSSPDLVNQKISLKNCRPIASTDCRFLVATVAHVWATLHGLASFKFQSCLVPQTPLPPPLLQLFKQLFLDRFLAPVSGYAWAALLTCLLHMRINLAANCNYHNALQHNFQLPRPPSPAPLGVNLMIWDWATGRKRGSDQTDAERKFAPIAVSKWQWGKVKGHPPLGNNIISQNIVGIGIQLVKCGRKKVCERKLNDMMSSQPASQPASPLLTQFEVNCREYLGMWRGPTWIRTSGSIPSTCTRPVFCGLLPSRQIDQASDSVAASQWPTPLTCSCLLSTCAYVCVWMPSGVVYFVRYICVSIFPPHCRQKLFDRPCRDRQAENVGFCFHGEELLGGGSHI